MEMGDSHLLRWPTRVAGVGCRFPATATLFSADRDERAAGHCAPAAKASAVVPSGHKGVADAPRPSTWSRFMHW